MTPTPNPTAEQILTDEWILQADRAKAMTGMDAIWFPDAGETLAALRAHGLLSEGAPSEEQIERASRAFYAAAWLDKDAVLDDGRTAPEMVKDGVRAALTAAGIAPHGSAAAAAALCDEVIADLGGNIQTHGPECYRWHAGCLALRVRQALRSAEFQGPVSARWLAAHDAEVAARQIDAPSVREAIGEVLADMEATAEGTHIASSLALLQEITDAAIRAAVSPPSRTAKRTGYETVGHGVGEHSQKITARAAEYRKAVE